MVLELQVQDQGAGSFGPWGEPASWLADGHLLAASLHGGERESQLTRALISSWAQSLSPPKGPTSNYVSLAVPVSTYGFGENTIQSVTMIHMETPDNQLRKQ